MGWRISLAALVCAVAAWWNVHGLALGQKVDKKAPPPAKPLPPAAALKALEVGTGLEIEQVLAEPVVAQPVSMNFDEKGRLWVVQYLQYPHPAGLKMTSRDKYWRVVYDKVPPPPPHHVKGLDKITIHEDSDGDGKFDKHTTFVEGLNIASSAAKGRGGVWVLNPPYLLFYPDKNNDDVPDGDPVVHLEGFGLEDTHSVVNSLRWGPDGWLYATQGSTVSGKVKRPGMDKQPVTSMGQNLWRYHPETKRYEIFAEGGGNAFGVEFDNKGRVYSGYNGGNTRGFHYVQGGYYLKGFSKHGELSNPYTFGFFHFMKHVNVARFTHTFVINEDPNLPAAYHNKLLAINPLQNHVVNCALTPDGSSFQTKDVGFALTSKDPWFRPVDIKMGPEGHLYVADFYEANIAHLRHNEGQVDRTNGRIYRLRAEGARPYEPFDLNKKTSAELVGLLAHENRWMRQTALRMLGDRKDRAVIAELRKLLDESKGQLALEALWALNLCDGLDDASAVKALGHGDPYVRLWTVRLVCDGPRRPAAGLVQQFVRMAEKDPHVEVRSQLASSSRRLPGNDTLAIVRKLLGHSEDVLDVHIPLLLWWALEARADSDRDALVRMFEDPGLWHMPMVEKHIVSRLMRRFAQAGKQRDLLSCATLLRQAPEASHVKLLLAGFEQGFAGRPVANLPKELVAALAARGGGSLTLQLRQGLPAAVEQSLKLIADAKTNAKERLQLIQILGEIKEPRSLPALLAVLESAKDDALLQATMHALQPFREVAIVDKILGRYGDFSAAVRESALLLVASRPTWTAQFLGAVAAGKVSKGSVPDDMVRKFLLHRDDKIQEVVRKLWGEVRGATTAEMRKLADKYAGIVRSGVGDPYTGRKHFYKVCGNCHHIFNKGGDVGPDLTSYKRDDLENMLLHIVNPSAEIREGFETQQVVTDDGRILLGFLAEKDDRVVVLRGADGQSTVIAKDRIEDMRVVPQSMMPEGILNGWSDEQIRDLFAFLRIGQPLNVND